MRIIILGDLHLGLHNKTEKLVSNLILFFQKKNTPIPDMIVVNGDMYDRLLSTNSRDYRLVVGFISFLINYCIKNNIILRVLEGTPSHDNLQMLSLEDMISEFKIDYKFITSIQVEYMSKFDKHILYVPDKMAESGLEIQSMVSKVMNDSALSKVDIACMHGNFQYQLPIVLKSSLDEGFFLSIVRYYIVINHIHMRSVWERIIAPGSFDRLEVNQESDKGAVLIVLGEDIDSSEYHFLSNPDAMRYDTIDVLKLSIKQGYRLASNHISIHNLSKYDHIRLKTDDIMIFKAIKQMLVDDGVQLRIERYNDIKKSETKNAVVSTINVLVDTINISSSNIVTLLEKRDNYMSLSDNHKAIAIKLIKEI